MTDNTLPKSPYISFGYLNFINGFFTGFPPAIGVIVLAATKFCATCTIEGMLGGISSQIHPQPYTA